jgi:hypothetical protein
MVKLYVKCPKCKEYLILTASNSIMCKSCGIRLKKKINITDEQYNDFIEKAKIKPLTFEDIIDDAVKELDISDMKELGIFDKLK